MTDQIHVTEFTETLIYINRYKTLIQTSEAVTLTKFLLFQGAI